MPTEFLVYWIDDNEKVQSSKFLCDKDAQKYFEQLIDEGYDAWKNKKFVPIVTNKH
jgi:hypothetical protein